jgi:putative acetyltransferase
VPGPEITVDDPRSPDVRALLERHLGYARLHTPPDEVHALDVDGLLEPAITFFSLRVDGRLTAVGALKEIAPRHGEIKSMHTLEEERRRGAGRAMLDHLLQVARKRGYEWVSLETGAMDAFAPARSLYERAGFAVCEPFGDYDPSRNTVFMTRALVSRGGRA